MSKLFRGLSAVLLCGAVAVILALLISDFRNRLSLTPLHQRAGALSFILIGAAYAVSQLSVREQRGDTLKGVLLGAAFCLWGAEQFLPGRPWVTAMDSVVVLFFVVDLSLVILQRLKRGGGGAEALQKKSPFAQGEEA